MEVEALVGSHGPMVEGAHGRPSRKLVCSVWEPQMSFASGASARASPSTPVSTAPPARVPSGVIEARAPSRGTARDARQVSVETTGRSFSAAMGRVVAL